jgi:hypothetical protein
MKVGDLIKCKLTGNISIVTWVDRWKAHFKVMGYPVNQVFSSISWDRINESQLTQSNSFNSDTTNNELSDTDLENVIGGMSQNLFDEWRTDLVNGIKR